MNMCNARFHISKRMPTYKNTGTQNLPFDGVYGESRITPDTTLESYVFYDHADLDELSIEPIYNPILAQTSVTSTGVGDDKTIPIDVTCDELYIENTGSSDITLFNSLLSYQMLILREGQSISWDSEGRIKELILQFSAAGSATVTQSSEEIALT